MKQTSIDFSLWSFGQSGCMQVCQHRRKSLQLHQHLIEMRTCWRGAEAEGYERFAGRDSPIGHDERGGEGRRPSIAGCSQHCPSKHAGVRLHLLRFIGFSRRRRSPVLWIHQSGCGRDLCWTELAAAVGRQGKVWFLLQR